MHLKGETFVQGNPPGCMVYTIPNVQFTERRRQELRSRSTNSLDDFVLATATGSYFELESPSAEESWSNHPLLEWAALRLAWICSRQYSDSNPTNVPVANETARASVTNAFGAIQIAQKADPTNGALWLAEASLHFAQKQDQAALAALRMAANNGNWIASTAPMFSYVAGRLKKAGLSQLDASYEADNLSADWSLLYIQGKCMRSLQGLMIAAVKADDAEQFSMLLKVLTELRRVERSGTGELAMNSFRSYRGNDEFINAMAQQMGKNPLPDSGKVTYEERSKLREQIAAEFISRVADQKTVASFVTQSEDYRTERQLRVDSSQLRWRSVLWNAMFTSMTGYLALLMLSLLVLALIIEVVLLSLRRFSSQIGKLPRRKGFWVIACVALIASTAVFFNFITVSGMNNEIGLRMDEPPPLISEGIQALLMSLVVSCAGLGLLLALWKTSKAPPKHWLMGLTFAFAYLASVALMAWFRVESVANIAAGMR
jgi:hypothetical protein